MLLDTNQEFKILFLDNRNQIYNLTLYSQKNDLVQHLRNMFKKVPKNMKFSRRILKEDEFS